jgi:hypothetical protein
MTCNADSSGTVRMILVSSHIPLHLFCGLVDSPSPVIAIWDNRSTFHAATYDYDNNGLRTGQRCVGIGERPYFDPASKSKREAEGEEYMEPGIGFTVF